jgi:hypothetical protein
MISDQLPASCSGTIFIVRLIDSSGQYIEATRVRILLIPGDFGLKLCFARTAQSNISQLPTATFNTTAKRLNPIERSTIGRFFLKQRRTPIVLCYNGITSNAFMLGRVVAYDMAINAPDGVVGS